MIGFMKLFPFRIWYTKKDNGKELLKDAARMVIESQQASVSMLQRKFRIGYSRAGRLIDELEALGIVSGYSGSKARDVLVELSYLERECERAGG